MLLSFACKPPPSGQKRYGTRFIPEYVGEFPPSSLPLSVVCTAPTGSDVHTYTQGPCARVKTSGGCAARCVHSAWQ